MVTKSARIAQFSTLDDPPPGCVAELLCEDHVGTYVLPFACRWTGAAWINARTGEDIRGTVVGWREVVAQEHPES